MKTKSNCLCHCHFCQDNSCKFPKETCSHCQPDKELCIKCKKYPAEEAQTYCEFCLGISVPPQTDKTTWEEKWDNDKEIQHIFFGENKSLYWSNNYIKQFIAELLDEKDQYCMTNEVNAFNGGIEHSAQALDAYREKLIVKLIMKKNIHNAGKTFEDAIDELLLEIEREKV